MTRCEQNKFRIKSTSISLFSQVYFIVCTDDERHVRLQWPAALRPRTHFMSGNSREVDMALLTLVDHAVISTGSFGWWAAYLRGASGSFRDWSSYLPSEPTRPLADRLWHSTCSHPPVESAALVGPHLTSDLAMRRSSLAQNETGSTFYYASAAQSGTLYHKLYFARAHDYFPPSWIGLTDATVIALNKEATPPDATLVERVRASVSGSRRAAVHSRETGGSEDTATGDAFNGSGALRMPAVSPADLLLSTSLPISLILIANRTHNY